MRRSKVGTSSRESTRRQKLLLEAAKAVDDVLRGSSGYVAAGSGPAVVVVFVERRSQLLHIQGLLDEQRFPFPIELQVSGKICVRT